MSAKAACQTRISKASFKQFSTNFTREACVLCSLSGPRERLLVNRIGCKRDLFRGWNSGPRERGQDNRKTLNMLLVGKSYKTPYASPIALHRLGDSNRSWREAPRLECKKPRYSIVVVGIRDKSSAGLSVRNLLSKAGPQRVRPTVFNLFQQRGTQKAGNRLR